MWKVSLSCLLLVQLCLLDEASAMKQPQQFGALRFSSLFSLLSDNKGKEDPTTHQVHHNGLTFCSNAGTRCELYQILGEEEAVESLDCGDNKRKCLESAAQQEPEVTMLYTTMSNGEVMEHELINESKTISSRGRCYDAKLKREFACEKTEATDGLVLMEDQSTGAVFAARPAKRKNRILSNLIDWHFHHLVNTSLNLEGL